MGILLLPCEGRQGLILAQKQHQGAWLSVYLPVAVLFPLPAYVLQWRPVTSIRLVAYRWAAGGSSP